MPDRREHALRRFAEGDRDDPLALSHALAGAQEERHARPAPIVDEAFERDEGLGVGFRIDARLLAVAYELAAHSIPRIDRRQRAEDFVLLFADRTGRKRGRRLHRHESENLEEVCDHHVTIGAGLLVESDPVADVEGLRHVDLHMIDEIAVPDRLEQAIGEPKGEDVLRRLLAQEMVDAEICSSANTLCKASLSAIALSRSVPNGFSMMTRDPAASSSRAQHFDR